MALDKPVRGGFVEWQQETSYGNGIVATVNCNDFGLVNPYIVTPKKITQEIEYLGIEGQASVASNYSIMTVGGEIPSSMTYFLQDFDMLPYVLGHEASFNDTVNTFATISGVKMDASWNYQVIKGNAIETWNWKLPEFGLCTIDMGLLCNDAVDPTWSDPLTSGTHATKNTDPVYMWKHIAHMYMDTNDPPTTEITQFYHDVNINFSNKYDAPRLPTVDTWTYIKGLVTLRRSVEITLDVSWIDYSWWDHVKDEDNVNFKMIIGGGTTGVTEYTFEIDSLRMLEFPRGYDPAKAIGGTVTFVGDHPTVNVAHA